MKYVVIVVLGLAAAWAALCIAAHAWGPLAALLGSAAPGIEIYFVGVKDFGGWDWMWRKDGGKEQAP